ncbi:FadR/GntR family transcriptional regulator [Kocuria sp.]|uniref:FadR/GntR family transcriptional regulator n=1 Tax=Kocuria sp. TaxID=1871328 RepID=UPI0026DF1C49|nr:FadR/GntR family transcriptional regulator [Kocuria sp.]MDO5618080.1 FadR/GntR family transcriptional regulator [Kocuria sp.]
MQRRSEVGVKALLDMVVSGALKPGEVLPPESELAEVWGMSRLSVREALQELARSGVVTVRHGKRGLLNPVDAWSPLEPRILQTRGTMSGDPLEIPRQMIEARRAIEVETTRLAATHPQSEEIPEVKRHLLTMEATIHSDPAAFSQADLEFHAALVRAAGNVYLASAYAPLEEVLHAVRVKTSSQPDIRRRALEHHTAIYRAVAAGDVQAAGDAMLSHMDQTMDDVINSLGAQAFQ